MHVVLDITRAFFNVGLRISGWADHMHAVVSCALGPSAKVKVLDQVKRGVREQQREGYPWRPDVR